MRNTKTKRVRKARRRTRSRRNIQNGGLPGYATITWLPTAKEKSTSSLGVARAVFRDHFRKKNLARNIDRETINDAKNTYDEGMKILKEEGMRMLKEEEQGEINYDIDELAKELMTPLKEGELDYLKTKFSTNNVYDLKVLLMYAVLAGIFIDKHTIPDFFKDYGFDFVYVHIPGGNTVNLIKYVYPKDDPRFGMSSSYIHEVDLLTGLANIYDNKN
jgi:hypothetical protein